MVVEFPTSNEERDALMDRLLREYRLGADEPPSDAVELLKLMEAVENEKNRKR